MCGGTPPLPSFLPSSLTMRGVLSSSRGSSLPPANLLNCNLFKILQQDYFV